MSNSQVLHISGFYFSPNPEGFPICWKTSKQSTVALSSCEAEYMALALCVQESMFLFMLLKSFFIEHNYVNLYVDNQSAIFLAKNPIIKTRSKHIDIKYHFLREKIKSGIINLNYISTAENVADLMTKPCTKNKLYHFLLMILL